MPPSRGRKRDRRRARSSVSDSGHRGWKYLEMVLEEGAVVLSRALTSFL
jgi:hypothetical protein